jgi:hypothetical protein
MLRFVDAEYYRVVVSVLNGLEMALNGIVTMLYIVDILYYTEVDDGRGIGNMICKIRHKLT